MVMQTIMRPALMLGLCSVALLQGCSGDNGTDNSMAVGDEQVETPETAISASAEEAAVDENCQSEEGLDYICGLTNAEDIIQLGDSEWLLASGMNGALTGGGHNGHPV